MLLTLFTATLAVLIALSVHEIGHLIVARCCNVRVLTVCIGVGPKICTYTDRSGTVWQLAVLPIAGKCDLLIDSETRARVQAAVVTRSSYHIAAILVAGPLTNIFLAAIVLVLWALWAEHTQVGLISLSNTPMLVILLLGVTSMAVGLFNLLPILPLDGGRLLLLAINRWRGYSLHPTQEQRLFRASACLLAAATVLSIGFLFYHHWFSWISFS
jgi:regulator of sigma E protease